MNVPIVRTKFTHLRERWLSTNSSNMQNSKQMLASLGLEGCVDQRLSDCQVSEWLDSSSGPENWSI